MRSQGYTGAMPRLRGMRLVGTSADRPLHDLLADPDGEVNAGRSPGGRIV